MKVTVIHYTTKEAARRIIEGRIGQLLAQYGHYLSESQTTWSGDRLDFSGKDSLFDFTVAYSPEVSGPDKTVIASCPPDSETFVFASG